jgi:PilZ domain
MREHRKHSRVEWNSSAKIYDGNGQLEHHCIVHNFSNGGAEIVGVESRTIPDEFVLRISTQGRIHRCRVIWRSTDGVGVKFTDESERDHEPSKQHWPSRPGRWGLV